MWPVSAVAPHALPHVSIHTHAPAFSFFFSHSTVTAWHSLTFSLTLCSWLSLLHTRGACTGCVQFGGHRIAGLSGTYVSPHYTWGHHERLPYDERAVKSVYHVRELEVHRLMQV